MPKKILPTIGPIETGLPERTFERSQGCWNCKGFSREMAKKHWQDRRQKDLEIGLGLALSSALGEDDPKVKGIRRMVDLVDHGVASGGLGMCLAGGTDRNGNPIGDFVKDVYLCDKWSGATGASVARAGAAPDTLPAELEDKLT